MLTKLITYYIGYDVIEGVFTLHFFMFDSFIHLFFFIKNSKEKYIPLYYYKR